MGGATAGEGAEPRGIDSHMGAGRREGGGRGGGASHYRLYSPGLSYSPIKSSGAAVSLLSSE